MFRTFIISLLFSLSTITMLRAQVVDDSVYINKIPAIYLCTGYNVDTRILQGETGLTPIFDSLKRVEPNAYPIMGQWCRMQRIRIIRMANSLEKDYPNDGAMIWIDSTHCVPDGVAFVKQLRVVADSMQAKSSRFEQLEKERLENEQRAIAEQEKAEALRRQRQLDTQLSELKDTIKSMHRTITRTCDGDGVTDRNRLKTLKDIFYAYLSVYNRYDISDPFATEGHLERLNELKSFQAHIIDSVLGPNSLPTQLEEFKKALHTAAGKEHNDVYKSYIRVFKKINIPITFHNIAEYDLYISQLNELLTVSHSYLQVIKLRDSIAQGTNAITLKCQKRQRDILSSYRELYSELNQVPAYSSLAGSRAFIGSLRDFIFMQQQYNIAADRVDRIQRRGDSLTALCPRQLDDIVTAYKELASTTDLVPHFINASSFEHYNESLNSFEEVQRLYINVIGIRKEIDIRGARITSDRSAPNGLVKGYKHMVKYTTFTPNFTTPRGGNDLIKNLNHFVEIQNKFFTINSNNNAILNNSKQLRNAFREYGNIHKAYERLLRTYDYKLEILGEADLNSYLKHQELVLQMQSKFVNLINSLEKEDYNNRLKKVRDIEKIRLIMGL